MRTKYRPWATKIGSLVRSITVKFRGKTNFVWSKIKSCISFDLLCFKPRWGAQLWIITKAYFKTLCGKAKPTWAALYSNTSNVLENHLKDMSVWNVVLCLFIVARGWRVGFFNFGSGRVRVLEKIIGSGRVRVRVLVTYIESIGYHRVSKILIGYFPILSYLTLGVLE